MEREFLKSRLAKLPQLPPIDPATQEDELDEEEQEELLDSFPITTEPSTSTTTKRRRKGPSSRQDLSPLSAQGYFDQALSVQVPISNIYPSSSSSSSGAGEATFRVYYSPPSISQPEDEDDDDEEATSSRGVVFVCVHGAGYSGLSYACTAKELARQSRGKIGVLAFDARGHGKTVIPPSEVEGEQTSMELGNMVDDLLQLLKIVFPEREKAPGLVLVGHSMGGAVVAEACNRIQESIADVLGVTVIDVVEGTALEALSSMSTLIASQPKVFDSKEAAIGWHLDSRTINNVTSARTSVPPLIKPIGRNPTGGTNEEVEREEEGEEKYEWVVDLSKTEPYWRGWFTGLSSKFLNCKTAKLLILAGTDRLDKELLIGQMQGKYQLEVFPEAGHCLHEDLPERTAETLLSFWERNDRTDVLKGVKKVGE
ncbi:phosphoprotein phosphatase methylesterase 1 [Sporobolomyces salmoneus]|uniref:phosphoprotein phosphatase methylesterase 1 n=1 Tax=Sporobolomyces salmoneus TaxID=183962 RepID=UPI0031811D50